MTKRSNRLRLVVKESGKTAKEIINTFADMAKHDRTGDLQLPQDPITISRHINAKRSFDIDMAVAYGKALDSDPADICFEPVIKNIRGNTDPMDPINPYKINWYITKEDYPKDYKDIVSVRVPRDFYPDKFKLLEITTVHSLRHGMIIIYEKSNPNDAADKKLIYVNPRNFNQLSVCQIPSPPNKSEDDYILGVPQTSTKNTFLITDLNNNVLKRNTKIKCLHPVVACLFPAFYSNFQKDS